MKMVHKLQVVVYVMGCKSKYVFQPMSSAHIIRFSLFSSVHALRDLGEMRSMAGVSIAFILKV
jgi:hypothetical protein